jgi:hypothetical protein
MKTSASILVTVSSFILWTCKDSTIAPLPETVNGFPLTVGSKWTYAVHDSVAIRDSVSVNSDTVEVTIDKKILTSSARTAYLWRYQFKMRDDTLYVVHSGDTVLFYPSSDFQYPLIMFIFPLQVGHAWRQPNLGTFHVVAKESVSAPAGTFANSYRVYQQPITPHHVDGEITYWLVPEMGIVRKQEQWLDTFNLERKNTTWKLMSYSFRRSGS